VLIYAWHPLTALEFSHSAHNDSLMVAPLVLALALAAGSRSLGGRWGAGLAIAVAALAKVTPLLLLPLLPRRLGVWPAAGAGLVVVAAWVSLIALGGGDPGSIIAYLGSWQDNDSIHALLRELLGARAAKLITLGCLAAAVTGMAFHPALRDRPLWWRAYVVLGLSIVLASTVHAWYLTWLLPLLAVQLVARSRMPFLAPWDGAAWLVLSGLVALPYLTYDTHEWRLWISVAEYGLLYALLAAAIWPRRGLRIRPRAFSRRAE
jgi:alpha-1,6-mannosyltransferase